MRTRSDYDALADRFLALPFAMLNDRAEIEAAAAAIRDGNLGWAINALESESEIHYDCGNMIKGEVCEQLLLALLEANGQIVRDS